jgi:1-acyl-sn-glycerol-3-phosphate acyltransferase
MFIAVAYRLIWGFLRLMNLIGWWRWRLDGLEHLPPRGRNGMIVVMNHVSWVDIIAIGGLLPLSHRLSWLAKSELFENPVSAWFLRNMQVIPVRRGMGDAGALEAAVARLRAGAVLMIFPEGTRSRSGNLRTGRGGAVRLAMQAGVPLVPAAIVGSEHGFRGSWLRKPLRITLGEPFHLPAMEGNRIPTSQMTELTEQMMLRIAALLPAERRGEYGGNQADGI